VLVERVQDARLKEAVAKGYHKLLAYKDEFEVARLHLETQAKARAEFEGDLRFTYHLAPPLLSGSDSQGRPKKRAFGAWIARVYPVLAAMKPLRGTPFNPFGYTSERRMERALIAQYEADMEMVLASLTPQNLELAVQLAELPLSIRGFGPVKEANAEKAAKIREALLEAYHAGGQPTLQAAQ